MDVFARPDLEGAAAREPPTLRDGNGPQRVVSSIGRVRDGFTGKARRLTIECLPREGSADDVSYVEVDVAVEDDNVAIGGCGN